MLGGTGFVGPFIVRQLLERGHDVALFHSGRHESPLTSEAHHVHGEFERLPEQLPRLVQRKPEIVVDVNPGRAKAGHGLLHFVGIAQRGVVLTSMDVYRAMGVLWGVDHGLAQPMPVAEDAELRSAPSPDLTADVDFDNLEVEQAMAASAQELPVTVLRCPVIYGPHDPQRRLRQYVRRIVDGRPAIVLDSRLARFRISRGYVENVAHAAAIAVADARAAGRTYNGGEPEALREDEWVAAVGAGLGWRGEVVVAHPDALPEQLRAPLPEQDLVGDTSRIRRELGYAEHVPRDEGLRRAIEWEVAQQRDEGPLDYSQEDAFLRRVASPSGAARRPDLPRSG